MIRKIVISVLLILAGVIATAGIASLVGWRPLYEWRTSERDVACSFGFIRGKLQFSNAFPTTNRVPFRAQTWTRFGYLEYASGKIGMFIIYCPFWFPVLLLAAYPTLVLIKTIRRRLRHKHGHCSKCGYNLTGNVSGTCPECGAGVERAGEHSGATDTATAIEG